MPVTASFILSLSRKGLVSESRASPPAIIRIVFSIRSFSLLSLRASERSVFVLPLGAERTVLVGPVVGLAASGLV